MRLKLKLLFNMNCLFTSFLQFLGLFRISIDLFKGPFEAFYRSLTSEPQLSIFVVNLKKHFSALLEKFAFYNSWPF